MCVGQTRLSTWKRSYRKWILLIFVQERERVNTKWKFYEVTNLTVFAAPLKDVPMGCKDAVLPEPLLINQKVNCVTYEPSTENTTETIFDSSAHLLTNCMEMRDSKKKRPKFSTFPEQMLGMRSMKLPVCSHDWYSEKGGYIATPYISLRHWLCGWRADWRTSTKK